jgi:hypothetical protein
MAINIWRLSGKPTSYNPMSVAQSAYMGIGNFLITLKAKSPTGSTLRVFGTGFDNRYTLTNDYKIISFEINSTSSSNYLQISTYMGTADIIIDSIELVQKPLPKLTINGIDGFLSGKWTLHANAVAVDDETLVLNATANYQNSYIDIPCLPSTQYTLNFIGENTNGKGYIDYLNSSKTYISSSTLINTGSITITTPSTANYVRVILTNQTSGAGTFTFKRPMLNMGSIPAPYSKKTASDARMVQPIFTNNLFKGLYTESMNIAVGGTIGQLQTGTAGTICVVVSIKPNTNYTVKKYGSSNRFAVGSYNSLANGTNAIAFIDGGSNTSVTINSGNGASYLVVYLSNANEKTPLLITEGTVINDAVQVNKKPMRYVPKKNLLPSPTSGGWTIQAGVTVINGEISMPYNAGYNEYAFPVVTGKTYTLSYEGDTGCFYRALDGASTQIISSNPYTFTAGSEKVFNVKFRNNTNDGIVRKVRNIQIEEGSTATPYEPYQLVLPKAKTGLLMDGVSNYVQLPSMTMDAIEIECLIDSVQAQPNYYLLDTRLGTTNGYIWSSNSPYYVGPNITNFLVDGVDKSSSRSWADIPKGQRTKVKAVLSSFTDDVTIFSRYNAQQFLKGILYKVTCYLAGQVVAQYDFENPSNLVSDKLIPNAKNLIPSFEDARWSLHSNFRVLGRDVGRLDATALTQTSLITIDVLPNTNYLLKIDSGVRLFYEVFDTNGNTIQANYNINILSKTVTTLGTAKRMRIGIDNGSTGGLTGTFDFIRPQLYQLSNEATLYGGRNPLLKQAKRLLYAKR